MTLFAAALILTKSPAQSVWLVVPVLCGLAILQLPIPVIGQEPREPLLTPQISSVPPTLPLEPERRSSLHAAIASRDYLRAEKLLVQDIERNPKSAPLLAFLGSVFFLNGKYLNSAVAMKKAEAAGVLDERNRFVLAMAYIALNQGLADRPELEKLMQSNPSNALYPYWLSRLAYSRTDYSAAAAHAEKAVQLDLAFMKGHDNLGLCYEALGRIDEAIAAYQEAIRLNRQLHLPSPWPSMNLGKLLLQLGRLEEAETSLRESLSIDPRFPKARFRLGQLLEKQKKYDDAIRELQEAAALDPSYPEPYYALGRIHRLKGETKSAEKALRLFEHLRQKQKR